MYDYINAIMHGNCSHCTNVITTGHSLGAALSGYAAVEIALDFHNVTVGMYNFGMPRIGLRVTSNVS